eukprot:966820-Rhodomonas_salina.1
MGVSWRCLLCRECVGMSRLGLSERGGGQDRNASSFGVPDSGQVSPICEQESAKRDSECRNSYSCSTQALWRCVYYIYTNAVHVSRSQLLDSLVHDPGSAIRIS